VADAPPGMNRILVVEDQELVQRAVVRMMPSDFQVDVAASHAEALAALEAGTPYAIALIDQGLPDGDGVRLARRARADFHVAGVIMSGDVRPPGMDLPWLEKPFQRDQLESVLRAALPAPPGGPSEDPPPSS
jgi:CheY-like chemotaxis protein